MTLRAEPAQLDGCGYARGLPAWCYTAWVALLDGEVAGLLEGRFDAGYVDEIAQPDHPAPQAWAQLLMVDPTLRSHGIQHLLVGFAAAAQQADSTFLALTADGNDGLADRIRFFQKCGLTSIDRHTPDASFGAPVDTILTTGSTSGEQNR
ncbi:MULTISPECIES: GNAT family N-acetyltransferase [unclassified Streptomyces]|uniref:GNAT family N-acetyltransferase n=1 Tax=unclassified Streptomyces TaxID=2593676 RepID=UPI0037F93C4D